MIKDGILQQRAGVVEDGWIQQHSLDRGVMARKQVEGLIRDASYLMDQALDLPPLGAKPKPPLPLLSGPLGARIGCSSLEATGLGD